VGGGGGGGGKLLTTWATSTFSNNYAQQRHFQGQSEHGYSVHWLYKQEGVGQANEHKMSNLSESQEGERFYINN